MTAKRCLKPVQELALHGITGAMRTTLISVPGALLNIVSLHVEVEVAVMQAAWRLIGARAWGTPIATPA